MGTKSLYLILPYFKVQLVYVRLLMKRPKDDHIMFDKSYYWRTLIRYQLLCVFGSLTCCLPGGQLCQKRATHSIHDPYMHTQTHWILSVKSQSYCGRFYIQSRSLLRCTYLCCQARNITFLNTKVFIECIEILKMTSVNVFFWPESI